jgi:hypothetical protein
MQGSGDCRTDPPDHRHQRTPGRWPKPAPGLGQLAGPRTQLPAARMPHLRPLSSDADWAQKRTRSGGAVTRSAPPDLNSQPSGRTNPASASRGDHHAGQNPHPHRPCCRCRGARLRHGNSFATAVTTWTITPGGTVTAALPAGSFIGFTDVTSGARGSCSTSSLGGSLKSVSALSPRRPSAAAGISPSPSAGSRGA